MPKKNLLGYQACVVGAAHARFHILMEIDTHPKAALSAPLNNSNIYPRLAFPGAQFISLPATTPSMV
jgi:hypothetical protein